jgi:hypothetical protein
MEYTLYALYSYSSSPTAYEIIAQQNESRKTVKLSLCFLTCKFYTIDNNNMAYVRSCEVEEALAPVLNSRNYPSVTIQTFLQTCLAI